MSPTIYLCENVIQNVTTLYAGCCLVVALPRLFVRCRTKMVFKVGTDVQTLLFLGNLRVS